MASVSWSRGSSAIVSTRTDIGVGDEFLDYRIDELIGRGGMGVVYRAYDLRLKRPVALKFIAPDRSLDKRFRERFLRESELAASLEHPNVVPIHDAGEIDGRLYLTMRCVEGPDLRKLLKAEGALEPSRALAICRQVGSALDAAHAKGLVHRDVKPSNVLLDEGEHVYLADFGLTRRTDEQPAQAADGHSIGTPSYLAPEQIEGEAVDGRADVYSLGCVLFECLTGAPPYAGGSRLAVAWGHLEEEPPSAVERQPALPKAIDDVIRTTLAKEPDDRYPTGAALVANAEQALELGEPPASRRRLGLVAAAVILVLLAGGLAAAFATRGSPGAPHAALFAGPDTLARIDPATSTVSNVIALRTDPYAIAIAGHSVWVYETGAQAFEPSVSEVDARTKTVLHTTQLDGAADDLSVFSGPVLAADAGGAWFAGLGFTRRFVLVRIRLDGTKRVYPLDHDPRGVAVGFGSVWIVGRAPGDYQLMRIDPSSGRVTRRIRFGSTPIDSIAVGNGAVWVLGSDAGTLYRIDPRSGRRKKVDLGTHASRPGVWPGTVLVDSADHGGTSTFIDPRTLSVSYQDPTCCPPQWGETVHANGWLWRYERPTGGVYRQQSVSTYPREIRVLRTTPGGGGSCLTSIAIGAGAVWVTAAYLGQTSPCH